MAPAASSKTNLDSFYLKIFKYVVVGLMTLALLAIFALIPLAGMQYFQTPAPVAPAKSPPERAVDLEEFKNFLIEEEKRRIEREKSGGATSGTRPSVGAPTISSLYAEQALLIQRCAEDFAKASQQEVESASEKELSDRREAQRANIERLAGNQFLGPSWPSAMQSFVCDVLRNPAVAKLKQENLVGAVVGPAIGFHARAWAANEQGKAEFRQSEASRVRGEELAESVRVAAAKASAVVLLGAAGGAFLFFMVMALYLIFAKIEDNLAAINRTILSRSIPTAGGS